MSNVTLDSTATPPIEDDQQAFVHSYQPAHEQAADHGSFKAYMIGFIASIVLTVIPFWLVMAAPVSSTAAMVILILVLGVVQIFVHLRYFLHMDTSTEGGWQLMALSFTLVLLFIVLVGSIWVMAHLHSNMMLTPLGG